MNYQDNNTSDDDDDYFGGAPETNPVNLLFVPNIEHLERVRVERIGVVDDTASGG